MSLLTNIVGAVAHSRTRITHIEQAVMRDVYGSFSRVRQMLEQDLRHYLTMVDFYQLSPAERAALASSFPFAEFMANNLFTFLNDMIAVEDRAAERIRQGLQTDFNEFEPIFWNKEGHLVPQGWADQAVQHLDWSRMGAFLHYIRNGATQWLVRWGAQAPQQLGTGIMGGEPVHTIIERITGVNVQTPEGQNALGRQVFNGMAVNVRYAVVQAANEGRTQAMEQMNQEFDLGLKRIWIAHIPTACPLCLRLHGTIVGVREEFPWRIKDHPQPWQGYLDGPPRHPNCKCTVAPWSDNWEKFSEYKPKEMRRAGLDELARRYPHILAKERRVGLI